MDVGDSLNPAIDIGQVEGAFTQGLGLFTMEECVFLKDGKLFTQGPGAYKIPSCSDIPIELNVSLMDHTPNPRAIFSSKVVISFCISFHVIYDVGSWRTSFVLSCICTVCY